MTPMVPIYGGVRRAVRARVSRLLTRLTAVAVARPPPSVTGPRAALKQAVLGKRWGYLQPDDCVTLLDGVERAAAERSALALCELGVATGDTGNRLVEFSRGLGAKPLSYVGVDNRALLGTAPAFEYPEEMSYLDGDRAALATLRAPVDFAFVDACHCAECVYLDSIAMSARVAVGGYMAFHDTSLLAQFPWTKIGRDTWQHYGAGDQGERPLAVVEGLAAGRARWEGDWELTAQTGDHLDFGGVRIYRRLR